jgi:hypothetical protein
MTNCNINTIPHDNILVDAEVGVLSLTLIG